MTIEAIKSAACARIRDLVLVGELGLQDGRVDGIHWKCRNPQRHDRTAGSFVVDIGGRAPGRFMEFAAGSDAKSGEGGDVIDLVSYCLAGPGAYKSKEARGQAIKWLANWTGIDDRGPAFQDPEARAAREREIEKDRARREAETIAEMNERAGRAKSWWLKQGEPIDGTPIETYLQDVRGVPLSEVQMTGAIRSLAPSDRGPHWTMFAAMVRPVNGKGEIRAVHMTYLTPDGRKADVDPVKKMWGDKRGASIRVCKGDLKVSPEQAAKQGKSSALAICEGIEDALSLAVIWPEWQIWAAGDVGNLRAIAEVNGWPPCASQVVLVADNDPEGSKAGLAFEKAKEAWLEVSEGREISEMRCFNHKDVNDAWRAAG